MKRTLIKLSFIWTKPLVTSKSTAAYLAKKESQTGIKCIPFYEIRGKSPYASVMDFCDFGLLKRAFGKRYPRTLNGFWKTVQEEWSEESQNFEPWSNAEDYSELATYSPNFPSCQREDFSPRQIKAVSPSIVPSENFIELIRTVSPVWFSRPRRTTGVLLAPCDDEFRGPRSDYVR
ncbi:hypothetical protein TNCV_4465671 [Trichonephila clavipes]|nr:hypothetical protein TNCV_4465671 [Trichonephila clavipes]